MKILKPLQNIHFLKFHKLFKNLNFFLILETKQLVIYLLKEIIVLMNCKNIEFSIHLKLIIFNEK